MFSFEGDFKRTRNVSLGGASKKEEKTSLLQRTQEERRKREDERRRLKNTIIIQSYIRGFQERKRQHGIQRSYFDCCVCDGQRSSGSTLPDAVPLSLLIRRLLFFYRHSEDTQRLIWLCQCLVKHHAQFVKLLVGPDRSTCLFQIKRLLGHCCSISLLLHHYTYSSLHLSITPSLHLFISPSLYYSITTLHLSITPSLHSITPSLYYSITPLHLSIYLLLHHSTPSLHLSITPSLHSITPSLYYSITTLHLSITPSLHSISPSLYYSITTLHLSISLLFHHYTYSSRHFSITPSLHSITPFLYYSITTLHLSITPSLHSISPSLYYSITTLIHHSISDGWMEGWMEGWKDDKVGGWIEMNQPECSLFKLLCLIVVLVPLDISRTRKTHTHTHTHINHSCSRLFFPSWVCFLAHRCRLTHSGLLYSLAFNARFLRHVWQLISSMRTKMITGSLVPLLQLMSRGSSMSAEDSNRIIPLFYLFSSLFSHSLISIHDTEFFGEALDGQRQASMMPFSLLELVTLSRCLRDACLGIIKLAHPETKTGHREEYAAAFRSVGVKTSSQVQQRIQNQQKRWVQLFKVITNLVKMLKARDIRRPFCPKGHWLSNEVNIKADKVTQLYVPSAQHVWRTRRMGRIGPLRSTLDVGLEPPPLSVSEERHLAILTELPFVVPFEERVKIFHRLIYADKREIQGDGAFLDGINVTIRRNYIYEDAYDKLSPENEPDLKKRIRVHLLNAHGLDEAGIDGGGIFREFLSELLKSGFNPNQGFFRTTNEGLLYPSPTAEMLNGKSFTRHYYFLGRILGKALYENMLVELPFASFFLSKLLGTSADVDIHHLASLDPEMYRNLLFLKSYEGDVEDLGLNFTVLNNDLGEAQVVELKLDGKDIPVTTANRIAYIHLVADYRLNKQIRAHCLAFRQGLANVLNLEWLRMFDQQEMQVLISGAHVPICLDDLKKFTNYSGGYSPTHPVIKIFWDVVENFSDEEKRKLLKFVTSCSRPPLLGFKDLYPAFCIHNGGNDLERLPSASTCMNLLKLPEFCDQQLMKSKLLYAIESSSGFELS
ncbi:ubiquitin-protein ligase E3C, partial [Silurus meridionalis]